MATEKKPLVPKKPQPTQKAIRAEFRKASVERMVETFNRTQQHG